MASFPSSGLRKGKWTAEEEAYATRVILAFKDGLLDVAPRTSLRSYLSKKLNCAPMRISKKFSGDASIRRSAFHPREDASPAMIERSRREIAELEEAWKRKLGILPGSSHTMPSAAGHRKRARADSHDSDEEEEEDDDDKVEYGYDYDHRMDEWEDEDDEDEDDEDEDDEDKDEYGRRYDHNWEKEMEEEDEDDEDEDDEEEEEEDEEEEEEEEDAIPFEEIAFCVDPYTYDNSGLNVVERERFKSIRTPRCDGMRISFKTPVRKWYDIGYFESGDVVRSVFFGFQYKLKDKNTLVELGLDPDEFYKEKEYYNKDMQFPYGWNWHEVEYDDAEEEWDKYEADEERQGECLVRFQPVNGDLPIYIYELRRKPRKKEVFQMRFIQATLLDHLAGKSLGTRIVTRLPTL